MRRSKSAYMNYVCPRCFHKLHQCSCPVFPPHELIHIDENMQDCIRLLNEKGYATRSCCEGHYGVGRTPNIHVSFARPVAQTFGGKYPDGFEPFEDRALMYFYHTGLTREQFEAEKMKVLDALRMWCAGLPDSTHM